MADAWYLYDTARWDDQFVEAVGAGVNTISIAPPPYAVLAPDTGYPYTSAEFSSTGTLSFNFRPAPNRPSSNFPVDTIAMPLLRVIGVERGEIGRKSLSSLSTKPTGNIRFTRGSTQENSQLITFEQEDILSQNPNISNSKLATATWIGFAAQAFDNITANNTYRLDITVNVGQPFRIVVPRIMAGVRWTPSRNFSDEATIGLTDPIRTGRRAGQFIHDERVSPFRTATLLYEDIGKLELNRFIEMFRRTGKTNPLAAMIDTDKENSLLYARMNDTTINMLLKASSTEEYNNIPIILEEVTR